ncbi:hypothetical protein [Algoriphagus aquimarinus]|nr:hypothetical protein [Algoriphagus aquimarinus]TXE04778.1 hypothetical protein ESV85_18740 [Algoriphagus aquimarinus]
MDTPHNFDFLRTGTDKKLIQQLTEYGQNLSTVGVNEIAIANVITLVITELQQKPVPGLYGLRIV